MTQTTQLPSTDQALRAINSQRRREVLRYLRPSDESAVALHELAAAVVDRTGPDTPPHDVETVTVDLHHRDLPLLDAAGLLEYDSRSRTVRYHGNQGIELLLCVVAEHFE